MSASIRGHQGQFKIYRDGQLVDIMTITSVDVNQDSDFLRTEYVGNPVHEGDQVMKGWSGAVETEVKNSAQDDFIDALINNNLAGIGVSDYTFVDTENYSDGTSKSYVYFDVQWRLSKRQAGSSTKTTKRLDFQAAGRLPL